MNLFVWFVSVRVNVYIAVCIVVEQTLVYVCVNVNIPACTKWSVYAHVLTCAYLRGRYMS